MYFAQILVLAHHSIYPAYSHQSLLIHSGSIRTVHIMSNSKNILLKIKISYDLKKNMHMLRILGTMLYKIDRLNSIKTNRIQNSRVKFTKKIIKLKTL